MDLPRRADAGVRAEARPSGTAVLRRRLRLLAHAVVACLPGAVKMLCYRHLFRFGIGRGVRIGLSLLDADRCVLGDGVRIGHGNVVTRVGEFRAGDRTRIGFGNLFRGGTRIEFGRYCDVLRLNRINAIPDPDCVGTPDPVCVFGDGSVVTAEHRFDFTDRIEVGKCTVIGGRNSSFWTHNRQATRPIRIGDGCYVGSEVRFAPGAWIPSRCIVGLGSVVTGGVEGERSLVAGVPARVVRPLDADDLALLARKTRKDLPDEIHTAG